MTRRSALVLVAMLLLAWYAQAEGSTQASFLPLIARPVGAPVATATLAPTATPVPVVLWPNGDFEQGQIIWGTSGTMGDRVINRDPFDPVKARSGAYAAILSDLVSPVASISQQLTIPDSMPYLSYWIWVRSTDGQCGDDDAVVVLGESGVPSIEVDTFDLCVTTQTTGWVNRVIDLRAYVGQTKQIVFVARSVGFLSDSQLYIDDVGWRAVPAA